MKATVQNQTYRQRLNLAVNSTPTRLTYADPSIIEYAARKRRRVRCEVYMENHPSRQRGRAVYTQAQHLHNKARRHERRCMEAKAKEQPHIANAYWELAQGAWADLLRLTEGLRDNTKLVYN